MFYRRTCLPILVIAAGALLPGCWDIPSLKTLDGGDTSSDAGSDQITGCVRTVSPDGDSTDGDGLKWSTAFMHVQTAVDSAAEAVEGGEESCQVWVMAGTYYIYGTAPENTLLLAEDVNVYGGFAGGEIGLDERDFVANVTRLDGSHVDGGENRVYHVVTGVDGAMIDGFTIQHGHAHEDDDPMNFNNYGGGMLNSNVSPTVSNCTFTDNHGFFGGAIENISDTEPQSSPSIIDCIFQDNSANRFGGAIDNDHSSPTITGCTFLDNMAEWGGGAINNLQGAPTVDSCVFQGNATDTEIDSNGGALLTYGAEAIVLNSSFTQNTAWFGGAVSNESASIVLDGCLFRENTSVTNGGAMHNIASSPDISGSIFYLNSAGDSLNVGQGGAIFSEDASSPNIDECNFVSNTAGDAGGAVISYQSGVNIIGSIFAGNQADRGGGLSVMDAIGSISVAGSWFYGNTATQTGGGMDTMSCDSQISACIFADNTALNGGAVSVRSDGDVTIQASLIAGNHAVGSGATGAGVNAAGEGQTSFINCTFASNDAETSGGAIEDTGTQAISVINSIFWGDTPSEIIPAPASDQVTYSVYQGGTTGVGNLNQDPQFEGIPAHIGTWNSVLYDDAAVMTTMTRVDDDWEDDALVGKIVRVLGVEERWYLIAGNTEDSISVWGDVTDVVAEGNSFFVDDYRLSQDSPCTDAADGSSAPEGDLLSIPRVDDPDTANTGDGPPWADIGAYEYYPDNMFGPGEYGDFGYIGLWDADLSVCPDLTGTGTSISLPSSASLEVTLSGTFSFYGVDRTSVFINENGAMTFGTELVNPGVSAELPYNNIPLVAVYWDELEMDTSGDNGIYYLDDGTFFHVQWKIPDWDETSAYDIRAALDMATGVIHFCYVNTNIGAEANGSDAVAGIQGDSNNGLTYSNSAPNLITGRHVRIVPPAS